MSGSVEVARPTVSTFASSNTLTRQVTQHEAVNNLTRDQLEQLQRVKTNATQADDEKFDLADFIIQTLEQHKKEAGDDFLPTSLVAFEHLTVTGTGAPNAIAKDVLSTLIPSFVRKTPERVILKDITGVLHPGEMCLVLGRPGAGCTSLLKTLSNNTSAFKSVDGFLTFGGISPNDMQNHHRGQACYSPEDDLHFPTLTVQQTLDFAATCRAPHVRLEGQTRKSFTQILRDTLGITYGLTHVFKSKVGNDYIRGVSGGERKRVSIAEMLATRCTIACWDNATRGLDSSTALEYANSLRISTDLIKLTTFVSLYQTAENIYDTFDKVMVLYEGRCIYMGPANRAKEHFIDMGYQPVDRQTTADFLVSVTSPENRICVKKDAPQTPAEMAAYFESSAAGQLNIAEVNRAKTDIKPEHVAKFKENAQAQKATTVPHFAPYTISLPMQIGVCIKRRIQIIKGDVQTLVTSTIAAIIQSLIVGSVYFQTTDSTTGFFSRGGVLFFAVLYLALSALAEMNDSFAQRPIVQRHHQFALYHPVADALARTIVDIPIKLLTLIVFGVILYFMAGLAVTAGQFFTFLLFTFVATMFMSTFFRALAAASPAESTASSIAGIGILAVVLYVGYVIPPSDYHPWFKWISYINPIGYAFEALLANDFRHLQGVCAQLVPSGPGYENVTVANQVCAIQGGTAGSNLVQGTEYLDLVYNYKVSHIWRNLGIIIGFWIAMLAVQLAFSAKDWGTNTGSITLFKPGHGPEAAAEKKDGDEDEKIHLPNKTNGVFTWENLCYEVPIAGGHRRLLNNVSGWIKPGSLTALMGESGAGKTTLLNVLAQRTDTGVVTGDMLVNGKGLPSSFRRSTGYCQQQDVHLASSTVREALQFSAILRAPGTMQEKLDYVETVIKLLEMEPFAEALVGEIGSGLNVEQRKRLTIGVELAARPALLLFLDEPTSGLDSQAAWSIVLFLRKLADAGQAVLCTIHQPSAELFAAFDRLLLLRKGGETVYFGDTGDKFSTLIKYFESNGSKHILEGENPAEWMLDVIGAGATASSKQNWHAIWTESAEKKAVDAYLREEHPGLEIPQIRMPTVWEQFVQVQLRVFRDFWRSPTYIISKLVLNIMAGLFVGFTFWKANSTKQGLQDQTFAIFIAVILSVPLSQQIAPKFLEMRKLYEARERPSGMYGWPLLCASQIIVELPWNLLCGSLFFCCWYWTVGFHGSAIYQWLMLVAMTVFYTTFALAVASMSPNATIAALITSGLTSILLLFCGVLQTKNALPTFWRSWLYPLDPYTYLIGGMVSNVYHGQQVTCADIEVNYITPPSGKTCLGYLQTFVEHAGGYLTNPNGTSDCGYCSLSSGDAQLAFLDIKYEDRWRNFGIILAYSAFNVLLVFGALWFFRIRGKKQ